MSDYYSQSYLYLNIPMLRRKLRDINRDINLLDKTIAHHKEEMAKYKNKLVKEKNCFFSNEFSIRSYSKSIYVYNSAIEQLKKEKEEAEEEKTKIIAELARKKNKRSIITRTGVLASLMLIGFVLNSGEGEIKSEVKETTSISKEDDSVENKTKETQPNLGNVANNQTEILDEIILQTEEYFERLKEKSKEK